MLSLEALDTRRSVPTRQLAAPGPDAATLQRMLADVIAVGDDEWWFPIDAAGVSLSIEGLSLAGA